MSTCRHLTYLLPNAEELELTNALIDREGLPPEFWGFARHWLYRVFGATGSPYPKFDEFIYLWIVFDGWATQIVNEPSEGRFTTLYVIQALGQDEVLTNRFIELQRSDDAFQTMTAQFASCWPIFSVKALRNSGLGFWEKGISRREYVRGIFHGAQRALKKGQYAPPCYVSHQNEEQISTRGDNEWLGCVW